MAPDPHVREIGRVTDDSGHVVIVGVDHGTVTLRTLSAPAVVLSAFRAEGFAQLYVSACWQAGQAMGPGAAA